jgi:hypothetical protein
MTQEEFVEGVVSLGLKWKVTSIGQIFTVDMACPLSALATATCGRVYRMTEFMTAGRDLGLAPRDVLDIEYAVDNVGRGVPRVQALRTLLLTKLGLEENNK